MIAEARTPLSYVDPFGLVCLGLGHPLGRPQPQTWIETFPV